jgi:hypothetical protein
MRLRLKYWIALGVAAVVAVAVGIAYAAIPDSQGTVHACMLNATGTIRLIDHSLPAQNLRSHCTALETEVTWSQQGPAGPAGAPGPQGQAGNSDSTVRHMSNFMFDGNTVSTPISSGLGQLGKLSLSCGSDTGGGNGTITYTSTNSSGFHERLIFYSPEIPGTPSYTEVDGSATFPWSDTPGNNILFEIMLEGEAVPDHNGAPRPSLTDIHGFVQHFDFGGCNFYVHVDTSDVNSPETYTP